MSLIKNLAGQTVIYGLGHILPRILHFIVFSTYLTYKWNDEKIEYAVYLDLYAYASVLIVLFSYRMDTALFRFGKDPKNVNVAYSTALIPMFVTSAILVFAGFLFADPLASWLTYPGSGHYIRWFSLIIAFDVLALLPYAKYRLINKALTFVSFKVANVIITVLLVFLFLEILPRADPEILSSLSFIQSEVDYVFLANLIASGLVFTVIFLVNLPRWVEVDWQLWKKMVMYSLPLIIVGIAGSVNQFFAVPLQKYFLGAEVEINKDQAAVYGAVQKIAALMAMFTTAYNYAAEPFFFRNSDRKDARKLYGEIALVFVLVAGFISLFIYLYIDVFQFIIGSNFRSGLFLIPILLMAYIFLGVYYNVSIWYKLGDMTIYGAIIASIGAVITLAGSIWLLPLFGIQASAWIALSCYAIMVVLAYILGQFKYPIKYPVRRILLYLLFITVIFVVGNALKSDRVIINLIWSTVLLMVYILTIYLTERNRIKRLLKTT